MVIGASHYLNKMVIEPWIQKIGEATQGRVKITIYPDQSLVPQVDSYDAIVTGIADIAWSVHGLTPGRFPLTEIGQLPGLGIPSTKAGNYIVRDLYDKFPEIKAEYKDMHLLHNLRLPPMNLQTVKKQVRTPGDIKGLKIRVPSNTVGQSVEILGGTPILLSMGDVYMALQKGVLDGVCGAPDVLTSRRFYEVEKHFVDADLGGSFNWVAMGLGTWNKLPPDIQKVFNDLNPWCIDAWAVGYDKGSEDAYKAKPADFDWYTLTPEEAAAFNKATAPVRERYLKDWASRGPTQAILDEILSLAKKYATLK